MASSRSTKVPADWQEYFAAVTALTDEVCRKHLNNEYAELARIALAALCRKKPSPLLRGHKQVWACAVVYALGQVNFLSDSATLPTLTMAELCAAFEVAPSTAASKAKIVRDLLGMYPFEPSWTLPSLAELSPSTWMVAVNGLLVDVRTMPQEVQEIAFAKGLIPYVPGTR
jgi:alkylhydroperoxidase/carboxymuconolactone decarboxylase family protein YurZ